MVDCASFGGGASGPIPDRSTTSILQNGARVATSSKPPKPKPGERDEPVKIDLDTEVAVRALLQVGPDSDDAAGDSQTPAG